MFSVIRQLYFLREGSLLERVTAAAEERQTGQARQSRLSVLTLSPERVGISEGATTVHGIFNCASRRRDPEPARTSFVAGL